MARAFPEWVGRAILSHEGGYVNDPKDPGGETKYGISKRAYPNVNIAALTPDDALDIYERDYWVKVGLHRINPVLGYAVFDFAVNAGPGRAVRLLQSLVKATEDGQLGLGTASAVNSASAHDLLWRYAAGRMRYYLSLDNAVEERFEKGWVVRTLETTRTALENL